MGSILILFAKQWKYCLKDSLINIIVLWLHVLNPGMSLFLLLNWYSNLLEIVISEYYNRFVFLNACILLIVIAVMRHVYPYEGFNT